MTEKDEIPIVFVVPRTDLREVGAGWKFRCKYCKRWHLHGRGLGHRAAHCDSPNSPYLKSGYIMREKPEVKK